MKTRMTLGLVSVVTAGVLAGSGVLAQRGPMPGGPMQPAPAPIVKAGTTGLFVLAGPRLVKYDSTTLQQKGIIELATRGQNPAGPEGRRPWMPVPAPPAMLLADKDLQLLLVAGNEFIRIDATKFAVAVRTKLPAPPAPGGDRPEMAPPPDGETDQGMDPDAQAEPGMPPMGPGPQGMPGMMPGMAPGMPGMMPGMPGMAPGMPGMVPGMPGMPGMMPGMMPMMGMQEPAPNVELSGNRLYILRGNQIVAVDTTSGKVLAATTLPKAQARPGDGAR